MQPMQGFSPDRQIGKQSSEAKTKARVHLNMSPNINRAGIETLGQEQLKQRWVRCLGGGYSILVGGGKQREHQYNKATAGTVYI